MLSTSPRRFPAEEWHGQPIRTDDLPPEDEPRSFWERAATAATLIAVPIALLALLGL
jgi:hypothetical protein